MRTSLSAIVFALMLSGFALGQAAPAGNASPPQTASENSTPAGTDIFPVIPGVNIEHNVPRSQARIEREVRHELLMLPHYSLFDDLRYRVQGETVELLGNVINATLKNDAERALKHIEGVEHIVNHINVLPPSPMDDRIRAQMVRAISSRGGLSRYFWEAAPSIHIIAHNGRVMLTGVVDTPGDKTLANIAAQQVPGVLSVDNQLVVRTQ